MARTGLFGVTVAALLAAVTVVHVEAARGADYGLSGAPQVRVPCPDLAAVRAEDEQRESHGEAPRFAIPNPVLISPQTDGEWKDLDAKTRQWRLRITSVGAQSVNLGFTAYYMPPGGQLWIYAADGSYALEPYTDFNNADHGQLWTAVVLSDDIIVEVTIPRAVERDLILQLASINVGYRGFGELAGGDKSGSCEIDVICPVGDPWRTEIPAVAAISTGGMLFCTGFMVNNTVQDQTPYFMTANHCGIGASNAPSLVVYWNFYSPTCGEHGGGSLSTHQSGATFRAGWEDSDFTLVQLSQAPDPTWGTTYAAWDARDQLPASVVAIHHPNCDEKSISFSNNPVYESTYNGSSTPGDGTHLRVTWETNPNRGVTEPGSSGSPLFDQNHRIIGQLHGGHSACGASDMRDWYGRFFRSWNGGGSPTTRLRDWLDSAGTGLQYVDTLSRPLSGLQVTPAVAFSSGGDAGGPFTPVSADYTLHNAGTAAFDYQVTNSQPWLSLTNASGTLAGGASVIVTVSINATANPLGSGGYSDLVSFTNTTTHEGDTARGVSLQVGVPHPMYSWNLDTSPGWPVQGEWAFGHPTGQGGGAFGHTDPNNGHTGANVYGVNLNGNYATAAGGPWWVTAGPVDLRYSAQTSLRFWRWLNTDFQPYGYAIIQVSNNGTSWTTVWQNGTTAVQDAAWVQQTYDISAAADYQPTVWVRWGYQVGNGAWPYSGWNIDDVEIWGLNMCAGATITGQPTSQTKCIGQSATFTVTAVGTSPLSYQWRKGGSSIDGATSNSYTITSVASGDAGSYDCLVGNDCGDATSNAALLTVVHRGDMNCDGRVTFADIDLFVQALSGESAWTHPPCPWLNGDCDGNGRVTFADIDPFVGLIGTTTQ